MTKNVDSLVELKTLESCSAQLVLTDPPYSLGFEGKYSPKDGWDSFSQEEFENFNLQWLNECYRILTDDGVLIFFLAHSKVDELIDTIKKTNFIFQPSLWRSIQRQKGRGSKFKPKSTREDIFILTKSDKFTFNNISDLFKYDETITNVLDISQSKVVRPEFNINDKIFYFKMPYYLSTTEKMIHSCQKSILLLYALIKNFSNENDTVIDPFMGSGSCGIACKLAKRDFIGFERDSEMFEKANEWLEGFNDAEYSAKYLKGSLKLGGFNYDLHHSR